MTRRKLQYGLVMLIAAIALGATSKTSYTPRDKAYFADTASVDFVRPGLILAIKSAQVAADGTITVNYTVTDPKGLPLDIAGITTPGAISLSFVASYIPNGQEQYVPYTTRSATGAVSGTVNQAGADTGGTATRIADGQYQYVFRTKASSGFSASATHTVGIYGSRNLTEFSLGANYASTTFSFVPNGSPVTDVLLRGNASPVRIRSLPPTMQIRRPPTWSGFRGVRTNLNPTAYSPRDSSPHSRP